MVITLYTKPECSLCDDARDVINEVRTRIPFELEIRNILDDLETFEKYKHDIPVILLDGHEIARHRLTEDALEFALTSQRLQ